MTDTPSSILVSADMNLLNRQQPLQKAGGQELESNIPSGAPPAYSAQASPGNTTEGTTQTGDSPYVFLNQFDTIFLIDDSGSMAGSRWLETAAALRAITPICTKYDANGIDIYFLNARKSKLFDKLGGYNNVTTEAAVLEIFDTVTPKGGTPTGTRLNAILEDYLKKLSKAIKKSKGKESQPKPLNIIVITDGVATDDVEAVIISAAKKLDILEAVPWQVGIQFFQVGDDNAASRDLKELDDALSEEHDIRDMVDTVPFKAGNGSLTAEGMLKVTLGAVNRRLDRKTASNSQLHTN